MDISVIISRIAACDDAWLWGMTAASLVVAQLSIFLLMWPQWRLRNLPTPRADVPAPGSKTPKVSVVVYANTDEQTLSDYLESIAGQDYPDYEVIVVCDATQETSGMLYERYHNQYGNVYVTFIPPGSHNLSRRKLALTLGIKAATGDIVITTAANALIPGNSWITQMTAPFINGRDIDTVIGYSHPEYSELTGAGKYYRRFISLLTDSQWIGYALGGNPYRGDGFNLAFRRQSFFSHKGYSKTIHLHPGDDDLFVKELVEQGNSATVINAASILTMRWGESARRMWTQRKEQYDFTRRWLSRTPFLLAGAASVSQWIVLICSLLAILTAVCRLMVGIANPADNIIALSIATCSLLAFWTLETIVLRQAAKKLGGIPPMFAVPVLWLAKPICNLVFAIRHRKSKRKNYTWQRK